MNFKFETKKFKNFCLIALCVLFQILLFQKASALTLTPPRYEFSANPGQKIEEVIKILNETNDTLNIYTSAANFTSKENEEGVPKFLSPGEKENDLAEWIKIEKGPITLSPSERKIIPFVIEIPKDADPGGHYAGIFFSTQPETKEQGVIGITSKTGALVLLRVSGDIKEQGELTKFELKKEKLFYEHLPIDFVIGFKNLGNVHLKPQGEILITNILGKTSKLIKVNKPKIGSGGNILPGDTRHFNISWSKNNSDENKEIYPKGFFEKLKAQKDNFCFGRYKANLNLNYGSGKNVNANLFFWIFPWQLILISILIIVLLISLILFGIKRYNRWIIKMALKEKEIPKKID